LSDAHAIGNFLFWGESNLRAGGACVTHPGPGAALRKPLWHRLWKLKGVTVGWRQPLIDRAPPWVRRSFGPLGCYLDMLVIDHGIFRLAYLNRHRLGDRAWRSAQPAPHDIRAMADLGVRTIVNLRGPRQCGSYWLEQAACGKHGIELVDFTLRSRAAPRREEIRAAGELFDSVEYPILMHCKSGSDRVGLMSALYRHLKEGVPLAEAKQQLSARYGHFRATHTGILDCFFERYMADNERTPMPFLEWVDKVYDPDELQRSFRAGGLSGRIVRRTDQAPPM
jgi:protein tyrosine/serine phosphatase